MSVVYIKIGLLVLMAIIALVFGLLPTMIRYFLERKYSARNHLKFHHTAMSLLTCFAGGVFLGVCLLDLMPMATESFAVVKQTGGWTVEYPFVELFCGIGFFIVYGIEIISLKYCRVGGSIQAEDFHGNCEIARNTEKIATTEINIPKDVENPTVSDPSFCTVRVNDLSFGRKHNSNAIVKSITFIVAFSFHSVLEGYAFGVQNSAISAATLFVGIILHKAVVAFSIGLRLARAHPNQNWLITILVLVVASTAPIGGAVGIVVENLSFADELPKAIVSTTLTCLALGTFLYITFFEILFAEIKEDQECDIRQCVATAVGFFIIAAVEVSGE
ncbi:hypothetical protein AB6A40_006153 [Gnathostoma spinigerum]|uniref:Uncharacterized protein n=1 Tax=Gnathostoma spinigerum TaxID=75299 RepID=A0ABD6EQ67_9BILA